MPQTIFNSNLNEAIGEMTIQWRNIENCCSSSHTLWNGEEAAEGIKASNILRCYSAEWAFSIKAAKNCGRLEATAA